MGWMPQEIGVCGTPVYLLTQNPEVVPVGIRDYFGG
jgi:hypothetical protein